MLKSVASNTIAQLVAKFVGAGLTFLTTVLIIRYATPALYGDLAKSLALIAIGATVIDFGLNAVSVRNLGRGQRPEVVFANLLTTRLVLSLVVVLLLNFALYLLPTSYAQSIQSAFYLGSIAIIFQGIYTSCNALFQSRENYWYSTLATVVGTVAGSGLTYYYLLHSPTLAHFLLATTFGYLVMAALSLTLVNLPFFRTKPTLQSITKLLKAATPLGAILLASVAGSKLDTLILGSYWPSESVGHYAFAYRIFDVLLVFPVFLMNAVYPRLVRTNPSTARPLIKRILVFMLIAGTSLGLLSYFLAPALVIIRPDLSPAIHSLRLLSLGLPLFFLTAPLMWYLIAASQERLVLRLYLGATLLNLALNLLLIPSHGLTAAALITGLTELFIFLSLLYYSLKLIRLNN